MPVRPHRKLYDLFWVSDVKSDINQLGEDDLGRESSWAELEVLGV